MDVPVKEEPIDEADRTVRIKAEGARGGRCMQRSAAGAEWPAAETGAARVKIEIDVAAENMEQTTEPLPGVTEGVSTRPIKMEFKCEPKELQCLPNEDSGAFPVPRAEEDSHFAPSELGIYRIDNAEDESLLRKSDHEYESTLTDAKQGSSSCSNCKKVFVKFTHLNFITLHLGDKPFGCTDCSIKVAIKCNLRTEYKCHEGFGPFNCSVCGKIYTRIGHLERHLLTHTLSTSRKSFSCDICKKIFSESRLLKRHILSHTDEKPYECSECGRRFAVNSWLQNHFKVHTGEKPFKCTLCEKSFAQIGNLKRHSLTHGYRKNFSCDSCNKSFTQSTHLKTHMRSRHTGERPFECADCGRKFAVKSWLRNHLKTHSGEKPFKCSYCDRSFALLDTMRRHAVTHTDEKPFSCPICNRLFAQLPNLKSHMKSHTGERPFECADCGRKFAVKSWLVKHFRTHKREIFSRCSGGL